ncbi:TPA: hypothetical protein I7241_02920 [Vibrio vulnificus]|uniref:hypothetical protein n=1 Tax=Vibrio sp. 05-20-BW147 TaxID=2575834 RepID=UPI001593CF04|nr:hypothetical protein [Vibrio sp. 05-20-BW147]NVC61752.1 hypothetical protein [Vibrio sp. 05-20-BW147]HAS6346914.1 hypothetical protein [Vibrio vulnificus]
MQKNTILKGASLLAIAMFFGTLGTLFHQHFNSPFYLYQGDWEGDGAIYIDDKKIDSRAFMLINENDVRLSIHNKYKNFNYTFDSTLVMIRRDYVRSHFDIENRQTRGLDTFSQNTQIDIPTSGNLLRLNGWRLDEGRLFIEVEKSSGINALYVLTKKSDH